MTHSWLSLPAAIMAIDPHRLREAFGRFPTGVTVVTTRDADGKPAGFTANSFTSVSLDPPLVLICPGRHLSSFDIFAHCPEFAVNILSEGQEEISTHFASFKGDRFDNAHWFAGPLELPWIKGAAAQFSCRAHARYDAGDHMILIGEVTDFEQSENRGLGFLSGRYFNLGLEREAMAAHGKKSYVGAIVEDQGAVFLPDGQLPVMHLQSNLGVRDALVEFLKARGLDAKISLAYSLYWSGDGERHYSFFRAYLRHPHTSKAGWVPIASLKDQPIADPVMQGMLSRYAQEYQHRNFGLYIGDETDGEVHQIEENGA